LTLQLALGPALNATKGFSAPEVGSTYARAQELCLQLNDSSRLFDILMGLRVFHTVRGQNKEALTFGLQLVQLADSGTDAALRTAAHYAISPPLFFLGRFAAVTEHCALSLQYYDRRQHEDQLLSFGQSHAVQVHGYYGFALYFLGYPEQALAHARASTRIAKELDHPFSLTQALFAEAIMHLARREPQEAEIASEIRATIAEGHRMVLQQASGNAILACAAAMRGSSLQELTRLQQAIDHQKSLYIDIWNPLYVAQLASTYGRLGKIDEGLKVLAEALTDVQREGGGFYEAELYRLKGELTLCAGETAKRGNGEKVPLPDPRSHILDPEAEAEACFQKAIDIAQHQQAKSLELRATMSLARLRQSQGKTSEAHRMLSAVYDWFTEGFDTKDLQEAETLLGELAGAGQR
jgi:tetratricopeptide (TPR) repeat protein